MDIPQKLKDKVRELDLKTFEEMKEQEFRPSYDLMGLKYLRDKAGNERNLRELYRGRPAYELLQNADDAHARNVAFILDADGLVFAHDGDWFTVDNFRSLADGWSDKNPNECIGHKGLGFRSVLDITPSPYLVKVEARAFFAVKFTWALNNGHIQEACNRDGSLRDHYMKWTKHGQLACPVMAIPGTAKKHNLGGASNILDRLLRGEYDGDFTTMFWFPAEDTDIDPKVLRELAPTPLIADTDGLDALLLFVKEEVSALLPFLKSVRRVRLYEGRSTIGTASLQSATKEKKEGEITTQIEVGNKSTSKSFFQMRYRFDIPSEIKKLSDTPKAVLAMEKAEIVLSVRLKDGRPVHDDTGKFHVYFPTSEQTGLGCFVHGDFFVKPDRTRLMEGKYNEWLLGRAAKQAANAFLSNLLKRYGPRDTFAALSPTEVAATWASEKLLSQFSDELRDRSEPFVPGRERLLESDKVAIPPEVDREGFWDVHFGDCVDEVLPGKACFLAPEHDNRKTREFLRLAGIEPVDHLLAVDFMEAGVDKGRSPNWWYDCYAFLVQHQKLSQMSHSDFSGRHLVPTENSGVIAVPEGSGLVICLPPVDDSSHAHVPYCFSSVFEFLDPKLAQLLRDGDSEIRSWVLDRFGMKSFEATDLLPSAVAAVARRVFAGEFLMTRSSLAEAWTFLYKMTRSSREIKSHDFWRDIGRFPVTFVVEESQSYLKVEHLIPAFLAYWPDALDDEHGCLQGVEGLRRLDEHFLRELVSESEIPFDEWHAFLAKVEVSSRPKLLTYSREAVGMNLELTSEGPNYFQALSFTGTRQRDENIVVANVLNRHTPLWESTLNAAESCEHNVKKVVGKLKLLEGFAECVKQAEEEFNEGDDRWKARLTRLTHEIPLDSLQAVSDDSLYCRGGSAGGHALTAGSCLRRQLAHFRWLPSSQGPASNSTCFLRQSTRRFISSGRSEEELGDQILPYVVVQGFEDASRLQRLDVRVLEDAPSTEPAVLIRALHILGERLSSDWGREEILGVRARWRLVRGAIQEAFRRLNQADESYEFPNSMKWAVRTKEGPAFGQSPLYYAEPGSAVEQAFLEVLPLIDVDRPYRKLFDTAGIVRLEPGETVEERFLGKSASQEHNALQDEIVESLSPYLLAPLVARAEQPKHSELVVKRLKEWFEVKVTPTLEVAFVFEAQQRLEKTVKFPYFYLQSQLVQREGAVQERHYTLYVAGEIRHSLCELDADALGEKISAVFLDGMSKELAELFPRIVSRFKYARGDRQEMENFMYHHLGISEEALDMARAMIKGEVAETPLAPPPPPSQPSTTEPSPIWTDGDLTDLTKQVEDTFKSAAGDFSDVLVTAQSREGSSVSGTGGSGSSLSHGQGSKLQFDEPTPEQQRRGEMGEEEIKRRLELPGGWADMVLVADRRHERCGYDFLCDKSGLKVKLEVKTFSQNGRVIVTTEELYEAAASGDDYFLLGVLDDGGPATGWKTRLIQNPFPALVNKGSLAIRTKLEAPASDIFDL